MQLLSVLIFFVNQNVMKRTSQALYVKHTMEARLCNHCCNGKTIYIYIYITYSQCVSVALVIQHTIRMHHIVIQRYNIFPHYLIKGTIFERTVIEYEMYRFSVHLFSETFLVLRRTARDIIRNGYCFHVKCLLFLSDFNET